VSGHGQVPESVEPALAQAADNAGGQRLTPIEANALQAAAEVEWITSVNLSVSQSIP